jgi:hypothetical protein
MCYRGFIRRGTDTLAFLNTRHGRRRLIEALKKMIISRGDGKVVTERLGI